MSHMITVTFLLATLDPSEAMTTISKVLFPSVSRWFSKSWRTLNPNPERQANWRVGRRCKSTMAKS